MELLCPQDPVPLIPDLVREMFNIQRSEQGSNRNTKEQCIIGYWMDFIEDIGGMFSYSFADTHH